MREGLYLVLVVALGILMQILSLGSVVWSLLTAHQKMPSRHQQHNDATADRKISQRNMKWRFGCQPAQIETNALLKRGLIETRLCGAHFTTTNHHHRSSHTHAPTQPKMVRPPTLTKLLTCSHHQLVNVVVLPLLRIMKQPQPPSPHLPLLSGTTMTWLKLRMI